MRFALALLILIGVVQSSSGQKQQPKLVIGIVIDQMKQEYLYRFENKFGEDGFKRVIKDGFMGKNMHYNYIPTKTAAGHASIYTGTTPRYHGIISNGWYSKASGRMAYCVGDSTVTGLGDKSYTGQMSPRNLQSTTITDEIKLTSNFRSKVIGVSIKDRGAVLPAGHTPDGAYWYDGKNGQFVSSSFYFETLPKWVTKFNNKKLVDKYLNQTWETTYPISEYVESTPDNTLYENISKGKETPTFPYDLEKLRKLNGPYSLISNTPFGNNLVLDFALDAIVNEGLGEDDIVDFLAVSLSSTDYVGHAFAPNSVELEDTYIKLDQDLGKFLSYLDKKIGQDQYVLFITSDHGVVANPIFLTDHNLPGGYIGGKNIRTQISDELNKTFGEKDWILNISNEQVFLNEKLIAASNLAIEEVEQAVSKALYSLEEIAEVYTALDLRFVSESDYLGKLLINGFNKKLSGNVLFTLKPGYLMNDYGTTGTNHGSGNTYDTHVPLIFYGAGIKKGETSRNLEIIDIAPTLSMLLNVSLPSASTGKPIIELFE